jgi:putative acyl-CoA dehydrogenase
MATFPQTNEANQPPPLAGYDLFTQNRPLAQWVTGAAADRCSAFGRERGGEPREWGRLANENPPKLRRDDEVEFHPAWHAMMRLSRVHLAHGERSQVTRAALFFLAAQVEAGHTCPLSMTHAAIPLVPEYETQLRDPGYEPELKPLAEKRALTFGMTMTERQGGSDLRANTTTATRAGDEWVIDGAKWFCSAPMSDAFLVLAQAPAGLSCFLLPRVLPDGTRNGFHIERLKDKLGDRSNASSEVAFRGALATLVGEEGRGVRTIVQMVVLTRLDCVLGTAAGMRAAVEQATHHAAHRAAFGKLLIDQPLMENVLADLCVESEAATATALRLAGAYERGEDAFARLATPVAKYWICKRGPAHAAEALECLGGNGYIEESSLPRLYRQQPLQSIWEGSGNIQCLDVLRALEREPDSVEAFLAELESPFRSMAESALAEGDESSARRLVERLAIALQGSLLLRHAPVPVAEAFQARLGGYGTLAGAVDCRFIIDRHRPITD